MKTAGFVVGVKYGKGYLSCRNKGGVGWSAPGTVRIEGGSFGFQIGASETDVVMLVMNGSGMDRLLSDKVTLGGEASIAAGPVGRTATAQTDVEMHAEILSWSRTQGVFVGIALEGATLAPTWTITLRFMAKDRKPRHRDDRRSRTAFCIPPYRRTEPLFRARSRSQERIALDETDHPVHCSSGGGVLRYRVGAAAARFGDEYLTYVLWAVTPVGRTSNLGEILRDGSGGRL